MAPPTISPTALKQHMSQLFSDLIRCHELCQTIRATRRLKSTHEALDALQDGLKTAASSLDTKFSTLRTVFGSRMDFGDEVSRYAIKSAIRETEIDLARKLSDVANRRNEGLPGFRDMLRQVKRIEDDVSDTLKALGRKLERPEPVPVKKPEIKKPEVKKPEVKKPEPPKRKPDEVTINLKELQKLTEHIKNSWKETLVAEEILYVNCWDEREQQWERPNGFIKKLPKQPKPIRKPSWDESIRDSRGSRSRPAPRDDQWSRGGGW